MKNIPLLTLLFLSHFAFSQTSASAVQEIKFNIGLFLATTTVEGSYEFFITDDTSIGGTIYADGDGEDFNGDFGIGPNVRAYFSELPNRGVFAEAFALYFTGEKKDQFRTNEYSSFSLGLGLGNKWVTTSENFSMEVMGGFARITNPEDFQDNFTYRLALSIGYRF